MNATRWVTLTEFVKHLGRSGIARVDETEKGWFVAWIDNSPKALAKQARRLPHLTLYIRQLTSTTIGSINEEGTRHNIR